MKLYLNHLFIFIKKNKNILSLFLYFFLLIALFISFFFSISKTNNSFLVPYSPSEEIYNYEESTNVGTFITDSNEDINTKLLSYLNEFFSTRNQSFLTGNVENLYEFYDLSHSYSKYSLHHEFKRIAYIRDWANERGITFENITSVPSINKVQFINNIIKLDVTETFKISYFYTENPTIKNEFAITLFHTEEFQKIGNGFTIQKDYYFDSFENALKKYNFKLIEKNLPLSSYKTYNINFNRSDLQFKENRTYKRLNAISYADKYSGTSTTSPNNSMQYNINYFNASSLSYGGNSTNFVSQCLGDNKIGGSLKQDKTWFYNSNNNKSPKTSGAWIRPKELKDYLIYSAKGSLVKNSNFQNLLVPLSDGSSPFLNLQAGDLIFYIKGATPIYSSIITSFDSNGYPLINSNTVNRFHVPFDLGWSDSDITFQLISIAK